LPVPEGSFAASGEQSIPENYISQIPAIAFNVPDLDSQATLQLKAADGDQELACITSQVNNGKSLSVPSAKYVAAGIAGAALAVSGLSALAGAGQAGAPTTSPTFIEVMGWFQSMALNGMMTAQAPSVYQSFSKNFAFSTGLIPWQGMQESIDSFRNRTGGNLTEDSVAFLKHATVVRTENGHNVTKRGLEPILLWARDELNASINGTEAAPEDSKIMVYAHGMQAYVNELSIPNGNTFMTVLLIVAIVFAAVTVGILLFKVILETWALFGNFPRRLTSFRKQYWWVLARTITNLVLLLYGVWTLYCVYQFKNGDSWAAKVLAGVTLAVFTAILGFFTWKIWSIAQKFKKMEGDNSALYNNKEVWRKYKIFYENYKKSYWWLFIPAIVYMFARGCVIAGADGHGLAQAAGQLIVEALMLIVLLWSRPYSLKSGNWINIIIQVVRVISVVCILVFVEELGVAQTTKTVTGLVLVVVQASLTAVLAILIAVNAIIICCKDNPHRKKRKEAGKEFDTLLLEHTLTTIAEKMRDLDNLTPLDARNSLLMDPQEFNKRASKNGYDPIPLSDQPTSYQGPRHFREGSEHLLSDAASFGGGARDHSHTRSISGERSQSPPASQAPRLPEVDLGTSPQTGYYGYNPVGHAEQGAYRGQAY
jgi:hypothetical protein